MGFHPKLVVVSVVVVPFQQEGTESILVLATKETDLQQEQERN